MEVDLAVRILVLGDLCLSGAPESIILSNPDYDLWAGIRLLAGEDAVVVANFESALTDHGEPQPFKWATLRARSTCVTSLDFLHVAVLGNNHVADFGDVGVEDTLIGLRNAGILTVGYGTNLAAAMEPAVVERNGHRLGVITLCCPTTNPEKLATHTSSGTVPLGRETLRQSISRARAEVDALLVYLHWGAEQCHDPIPDQMRIARHAIDAGADAVVGSHAHVIQGYEQYQGKWIFYGLGNFLFGRVETQQSLPDGTMLWGWQEQGPPNRQSLVVSFSLDSFDKDCPLKLEAVQSVAFGNDFVPRPIETEELTINLDTLNRRIERYGSTYAGWLRSEAEPVLQTKIVNGKMAFFYSQNPISDDNPYLRRRVFGKLRSIMQKLVGR
jgi:hypothetical protein